MKTYIKKSFICLSIILLTLSCFCCTSVQASGIQTYAYYSPSPFQFSGISNSIARNYDGNYMAIEARATSSSGTAHNVKIHVFIYSRNITETYTFPSNGSTYKFDYIYLGNEGSSDTGIVFECNSADTITMKMTSYSWYS